MQSTIYVHRQTGKLVIHVPIIEFADYREVSKTELKILMHIFKEYASKVSLSPVKDPIQFYFINRK